VIKPHDKTPYEIFLGRKPALSFMKPFGCPVKIINTLDHLGPKSSKNKVGDDAGMKSTKVTRKENGVQDPAKEGDNNDQDKDLRDQEKALRKQCEQECERLFDQEKAANTNSTNRLNTISSPVNVNTRIFSGTYDDKVESAVADFNNLELTTVFSPIPTTRIHKDHPKEIIIGDPLSAFQTRRMIKTSQGHAMEEVYVCQPLGFEDPDYPDKIYVDDIIFGSTNKDLCKAFEKLMKDKFQMSSMGELTFFLGLQVKQKLDGIFISQDKYVAKILRKFGLTDGKLASTPIDTEKPLLKDPDGEDVDMHTYRSMIGSLMYLTSSRPDIMFVVCACARFQVTPKALHLHAVKRIFRYLKGKPNLGLWYLKDSPLILVAYSDSDYAGASLDRKSTTRGCQFLGCRLISWQCKKQTVVATSSTEAEYVAAASCCTQVLWIQNQLLDYGSTY
nr:hypothetical protein [Tanacetum cinerariifolium]